ncbi:ABC transporter substrate-binding protein [Streptomyces sp. SBT349]|uniref:ABC transporter substrate-binding protein n=1 Tax=Streptomyces sp. SBT349 TaxID=1580539 RepID=UPI000AA4C71D|nr:extracellular solute-binding protein [Streptomyces sp. SBT349]
MTPLPPPIPPGPLPGPLSGPLSRRRLLRLGGGLGAAGLFGGVLSGCADRADAEPVTSGDVDLAFWTHDQAYVDFFQEAADNAAAAGAGPFTWELDATRTGATDIVTKSIAQAIAGRGTPDVAGLEIGAFPRLLRGDLAAELLEPLNDAVADVADDLLTVRTAPFTRDGTLYALDSDAPLVVYYYREPEWERVGLPTDLGSWEELADAASRVRERHDICIGAACTGSDLGQVVQSFDQLLMQRGGRLFGEDGTLLIESPEGEETLAHLVRGVQEGWLATIADPFGPGTQAAFKSGQLIGQWAATWYKVYGLMPNAPEQAGEWRIRALPRFEAGGSRASFTGGTGFAAFRGQENTLASVELIKAAYLTPEEQVRRYLVLGYLPTRRSVFENEELLTTEDEFCGGQRMFEVYRDVIDEAPAVYLSADKPILDTVLSGYLLRAYHGDLSPREALGRAAEDFHGQTRSSRS